MAKRGVFLLMAGVAMALAACGTSRPITPLPTAVPTPDATAAWQAACLQATVRALEMERERYEGWLKGASGEKAEVYRQALAYLDAELAKYRSLPPTEFRIASVYRFIPGVTTGWYGQDSLGQPTPITLDDAWVGSHRPELLSFAGQTRSGPFYIVVGVRGGDLSAIKPGVHYRMVLQPLMPQVYPFPSVYVCVKQFEKLEK
jgi:hypothetical protein